MKIPCLNMNEDLSVRIYHSISDYDWWGCPKNMVILFCRKGKIKMSIDSEIYELSPCSVVFLSPGNLIHFIKGSEELEFTLVMFSEDFLSGLKVPYTPFSLLYLKRYPFLILEEEPMRNIETGINLLELAYENRDSHFRQQIIRLQVQNFLMNVCDKILHKCSWQSNGTITGHMVEQCIRFILLVQKHHISRYDSAFYAAELQISERYLRNVVRTVLDSTVRDVINLYTLSDIKCLLKFTRLTHKEISAMLKFSSSSLFSRYFKNMIGVSPGMYRRQHLDPTCLIESYD